MNRQEIIFTHLKRRLEKRLGVSPVEAADLATAHLGDLLGDLLANKIEREGLYIKKQAFPGHHPYAKEKTCEPLSKPS